MNYSLNKNLLLIISFLFLIFNHRATAAENRYQLSATAAIICLNSNVLRSGLESLCQSSRTRLLIQRREVVTGLVHDVHHPVERHPVIAVADDSVELSVESAAGRECVPLDTRNLHETTNGVAGHSKVMLKAHFGGILNLRRCASENLTGRRSSHGACRSHLALASDLCSGD